MEMQQRNENQQDSMQHTGEKLTKTLLYGMINAHSQIVSLKSSSSLKLFADAR